MNIEPAATSHVPTTSLPSVKLAVVANCSLLPVTNRWLESKTCTSDPLHLVVAPWETVRRETPARTYDSYTKNGNFLPYNSLFVLVPDLDIGFTILETGPTSSGISAASLYLLADMIAAELLPYLKTVLGSKWKRRSLVNIPVALKLRVYTHDRLSARPPHHAVDHQGHRYAIASSGHCAKPAR